MTGEVASRAWSATAAFFVSILSSVWSFLVGFFMFLPRIIHDLAVPPDDDEDQGAHMLTWEFGQAYRHLPSLLRSLAFKPRNLDEQLREAMLRGNLRRTFSRFDLAMVGIGLVVGSGVFYKGGIVQAQGTGSAVFLAYIIDFVPIFLTALIYAEFTVEYPVAGGAFTWTMSTLGEFPALMTLGLLLVNYVLSIAAVARVLTFSIALLVNVESTVFLIDIGGTELDFLSFGITLFLTILLCAGTAEAGFVLAAANITGIFFILFVGIAGFTEANADNFVSDWMPYGVSGLFQALPGLLFSYIGFDAIAYAIEEAKDQADAPSAYMWTVGVSGALYVFMALSLAFLTTSVALNQCTNTLTEIVDCSVPGATKAYYQAFVFAFDSVGMQWMQYIFAIGSAVTITTTLLVALFISARLIMVGAREWMLPPMLAQVSKRTKTPIVAQVLVGCIAAILALFTGYNKLSDLASFAYLCTMLVVCNAYLGRRYYPDVKLRYSQFGTVEATPARFMSAPSNDLEINRTMSTSVHSTNPSIGGLSDDARTRKRPSNDAAAAAANNNVINTNNDTNDNDNNTKKHAAARAAKNQDPSNAETGITKSVIVISHSNSTDDTAAPSAGKYVNSTSDGGNPGMWIWSLMPFQMNKKWHRWMIWSFIIAINGTSICVGVLYRIYPNSLAAIWALIVWAAVTIAMCMTCPVEYTPETWHIPGYLLPFIPSVSILGIVFVASNLAAFDYIYSLVIAGAVALFYVFFSMPLSYIRNHSANSKGDGTRVIELVYKHGNWISVDQMTTRIQRWDDRYNAESPGINSLPGSIIDRNRTISRTMSQIGSIGSLLSQGDVGSIHNEGSGGTPIISSRLSSRLSSGWSDSILGSSYGSGGIGSMDLYTKTTAKGRVRNPKLETITDDSFRTSDGGSRRSLPSPQGTSSAGEAAASGHLGRSSGGGGGGGSGGGSGGAGNPSRLASRAQGDPIAEEDAQRKRSTATPD